MLEAAEGGVLDRRGVGVGGVDLDDVARAVRLVVVLRRVEAGVPLVVVVSPAVGTDTIALVARVEVQRLLVLALFGRAEVAVEVLFAGQVSAPGRPARTAVVERPERVHAGGVVGG